MPRAALAAKHVVQVIFVLLACASFSACGGDAKRSENVVQKVSPTPWTIMVYMNAKNNLEGDAIDNFYEIAQVQGIDRVNLLVEMGRPKNHYSKVDEAWDGVMRFRVTGKESKPRRASALDALGDVDMASPETLRRFVEWSMEHYPAQRYMLIVWNHGQGWRFQRALKKQLRDQGARRAVSDVTLADLSNADTPGVGGFRAISYDEDSGNLLYNRQLQDELQGLAKSGKRIDVLGFDACLMAMVETAYAFRSISKVMIASEELEPGAGWPYLDWLSRLVSKPSATPQEVGAMVVEAYGRRYGNNYLTTLSAIELGRVEMLAQKISALSTTILQSPQEMDALVHVRKGVRGYGDWATPSLGFSVDLDFLLRSLEKMTTNATVLARSHDVRQELGRTVIRVYASSRLLNEYGGAGLAIYYPNGRTEFDRDDYRDGYRVSNTFHPVEFVQKEAWSQMLAGILGI
ncbi:MAG: hypothetical protein K2Y35_13340 [Burkholderiales bacterium]|nr:hypothetical protein [Burkholderiales bacterium]